MVCKCLHLYETALSQAAPATQISQMTQNPLWNLHVSILLFSCRPILDRVQFHAAIWWQIGRFWNRDRLYRLASRSLLQYIKIEFPVASGTQMRSVYRRRNMRTTSEQTCTLSGYFETHRAITHTGWQVVELIWPKRSRGCTSGSLHWCSCID